MVGVRTLLVIRLKIEVLRCVLKIFGYEAMSKFVLILLRCNRSPEISAKAGELEGER